MKSAVKDEAVVYFVELFNSWGSCDSRVWYVWGKIMDKLVCSVVCCGRGRAAAFSRQLVRKEFGYIQLLTIIITVHALAGIFINLLLKCERGGKELALKEREYNGKGGREGGREWGVAG